MSEVTELLEAVANGDPTAASRVLPLIYDELRKLAAQKLAHEKAGQTPQPTALVHEAYLRLVGGAESHWNGREEMAAAEAMRRILVERARHRQRLKAGGDRQRQELPDIELAGAGSRPDLLTLHEALTRLKQQNPRRAELVKLRFIAGLTIVAAAQALGVSDSTADTDWA